MSTETKYYCDFKGCGKEVPYERDVIYSVPMNVKGYTLNLCPEHAKYIFELFEKESK